MAEEEKKGGVSSAVIQTIGAILVALIGVYAGKRIERGKPRLVIDVFDAVTSQGVAQANLDLRTNDGVVSEQTDGVGRHTFTLDTGLASTDAFIQIAKQGYSPHNQQVRIPQAVDVVRFYLRPTTVSGSVPATPSPGVPSPGASGSPSATPSPVLAQFLPKIFTSGAVDSGRGSNFSNWYRVCSSPPPPGYKVASAEFKLSGDRQCNAWSECRQVVQTDDQVCWEFRLQGHDEWFPPRPAKSEGLLTVTFKR